MSVINITRISEYSFTSQQAYIKQMSLENHCNSIIINCCLVTMSGNDIKLQAAMCKYIYICLNIYSSDGKSTFLVSTSLFTNYSLFAFHLRCEYSHSD